MGYRNLPMEVRKEYAEPLSEVIKGYALMGYSKRATAAAMEVGIQALIAWIRRLDLDRHFSRPNYNESCKGAIRHHIRNSHSTGRPRAYSDQELLSYVAMYPRYHLFLQVTGIPAGTTVIRRFGSWGRAKALAAQLTNN